MNVFFTPRGRRGLTTALAMLVLPSCGQAILVASPESTMVMTINPTFIAQNGDTAVVSVLVIEKAGTPAPDGTVVQFFTTLGRIQEQGKTNDGVVRVNLISDARSGDAVVTAFSGASKTEAITVRVGSARPARLSPGLIDQTIDLSDGKTIARIKASVFDANANPVSGVLVRFSITDDPATDHIIETGDVPTDNSGDASVRVQTSRLVPGTIKVHIEVLSGTALTADLSIPVIK